MCLYEQIQRFFSAHTCIILKWYYVHICYLQFFFTRIHNTELAGSDDSSIARRCEKTVAVIRSRFSLPSDELNRSTLEMSSMSTPSRDENVSSVASSGFDIINQEQMKKSSVQSSTRKSSGSSQKSLNSYRNNSTISTDDSLSDFNISRAATKLAFEICIEEDSETPSVSDEYEHVSR